MSWIITIGQQVWCGENGWQSPYRVAVLWNVVKRYQSKGMAKRIAIQHGFDLSTVVIKEAPDDQH